MPVRERDCLKKPRLFVSYQFFLREENKAEPGLVGWFGRVGRTGVRRGCVSVLRVRIRKRVV